MMAPPAEGGLAWDAPAGCPTAQQVEAAVARLLAVDASPRLPARGSIVAHEVGYTLTVEVADQTRVITASTCEPLGTVAALVIAVAHDPLAVADAIENVVVEDVAPASVPPPEPTPIAEASTRVEQTPVRPRDRTPPREHERVASGVRAGVLPFLAVGGAVLPRAGVGFGLGVAAFGRSWRVEIGGAGHLPRRAQARDDPRFGADLWLAGGSLRGCGVPRAGTVDFPLCGGAELDAWVARGRGPALEPRPRQTQIYVAALASAGATVQLRPWIALAFRAELLVSLRRPAVHIDRVGYVYRASAVAGRLVLGPEFRFP